VENSEWTAGWRRTCWGE